VKRASDQVDFQVKESTKGSHLRGQSEETLQATAHLKTTSNQCHQQFTSTSAREPARHPTSRVEVKQVPTV
jgi:hypothetical protein